MRPVGYVAQAHILQLAFLDELANTLLCIVVRIPGPATPASHMLPLTLDMESCRDAPALDGIADFLEHLCAEADLVVFGRISLAFLPRCAVARLRNVSCVRERYSHHRGCLDSQAPGINQPLIQGGFPALRTNDAVMRALAIRDLHYWLLDVEAELGLQAGERPSGLWH